VQSLGKDRLLCITAPGRGAAGALHICKEVQGKVQVSSHHCRGRQQAVIMQFDIPDGVRGTCRSVKPCLLLI